MFEPIRLAFWIGVGLIGFGLGGVLGAGIALVATSVFMSFLNGMVNDA